LSTADADAGRALPPRYPPGDQVGFLAAGRQQFGPVRLAPALDADGERLDARFEGVDLVLPRRRGGGDLVVDAGFDPGQFALGVAQGADGFHRLILALADEGCRLGFLFGHLKTPFRGRKG